MAEGPMVTKVSRILGEARGRNTEQVITDLILSLAVAVDRLQRQVDEIRGESPHPGKP